MGQFTFNIDEDLRRTAKVYAARRGTSLSDLIRDLLASKVGWKGSMIEEPDDVRTREILAEFGNGLIERSEALRRLGRDPSEVIWLRDLVNALNLAWPLQDRLEAQAQSEGLLDVMWGEDE